MTIINTATGIKMGSKGRVAKTAGAVGLILGSVSKSEARKARKHLHAIGKRGLAATVRLTGEDGWHELEAAA